MMITIDRISQTDTAEAEVAEYGVVTITVSTYPLEKKPCMLRYVGKGMVEFLCNAESGELIYVTIPGLSHGRRETSGDGLPKQIGLPVLHLPTLREMTETPACFLKDFEVSMHFGLVEKLLQVRFGDISPTCKVLTSGRVEFVLDGSAIVALNVGSLSAMEYEIVRFYVCGGV